MKKHFIYAAALGVMASNFATIPAYSNEGTSLGTSAFDAYVELIESGVTLRARSLTTADGAVTFGAEKEGSSSLITRVMGPSGESFKTYAESQGAEFLRTFLQDYARGYSRNSTVVDMNGVNKQLTDAQIRFFSSLDYSRMGLSELKIHFEQFIQLTEGKPFSYLKKSYRQKIFKGQINGQSSKLNVSYLRYVPHFGAPEKYIANSHGTGVGGWEMNFNPMMTYGEFEGMIRWFKTELKNVGKLFEAPGHQRIVYPVPQNVSTTQRTRWFDMTNETIRHVQAYIVARGILGKTGIETSNYKQVLFDKWINSAERWDSGRGVVRLDDRNRFVENHNSLELRAGTKDAFVQQFVEQVFSARVSTGDFSGMKAQSTWTLIPEGYFTTEGLVTRFGVSETVARKFVENSRATIKKGFQIALWQWENAPYTQTQKSLIKSATRNYIEFVATTSDTAKVKEALRRWVRTTRVDVLIRNYMLPERIVQKNSKIHHYRSTGRVDVNRIDLGIEYSGRFQTQYSIEQSPTPLADGNKAWLQTISDMTPHERAQVIKDMAETLGRQLNGGKFVSVVDVSKAGAHGHGLSVAYEVRDSENRKWRVEWDGVGRTYTQDGRVIPESLRGGHIEIVTPKFIPDQKSINALFSAMNKQNIIPSLTAGGGHINVDLAPFEGNPKALARFLSSFHEHRGIISFLFNNINRAAAAEQIEISENLRRRLRNFTGTEAELKQLLYNERYFNQRLGRKTRNVQIDMSGYFQDVIPQRHIHQDFDMKNPNEPWRPQFRVEPHIRKMEMRLFDAPLNAYESSMQIKLVRALLNKALNESSSMSGSVQGTTHSDYAENVSRAEADLRRMCESLGLNYNEYKLFLARAVTESRRVLSSRFYKSYEQKVAERGWNKINQAEWGRALTSERVEGISSSERNWEGVELEEARRFRESRLRAAAQGEAIRDGQSNHPQTRREIKIGVNCRSVFAL